MQNDSNQLSAEVVAAPEGSTPHIFEEIETIVVLVHLKAGGTAHQVLTSDEVKRIALLMIAQETGTLLLSEEIEPLSFNTKPKINVIANDYEQ